MRMAAAITDGLRAQVCWLGLRVGSHEALSVHSSDKPSELSQWTLTVDSHMHNKHYTSIIRPHRIITYITEAYCYRLISMVCLL